MLVAAYLPADVVTQGQKLALMKICDSADDETRLSKPGMKRVRAWVGCGEKRCTTIVTELVAKGLIERVEVGMLGRRAVYRVFPLGVPPIPSNDDLDARFQAADAAPKNPNKARSGITRAAPSKPAMTHEDIDARTREDLDVQELAAGEGVRREPGFHGWNPDDDEARVPPVEPQGFHGGNPKGSTGGTPSFPSSTGVLPFPLPPRLTPQGSRAAAPSTRLRLPVVVAAKPIRAPSARHGSGSGRRRSGSRSGSSWRTGTRTKPRRGRWPATARRTWRRPGSWPARRHEQGGKGSVTPAHPKNKTGPPTQVTLE